VRGVNLERQNPIIFLASAIDGCALWRLFFPYLSLPGSSFFCFRQKIDYAKVVGNEICVVQRLCTQNQFDVLRTMASLGLKIIYDLDDDVWEIPQSNPAHGILGQYKEGFKSCIRMVDVVTVSTHYLAKVVRRNVKAMVNLTTGKPIPIVVVENRVWEQGFVRPERPEKVTVGWAGSSSHVEDLEVVLPVLYNLAKADPKIEVEMRGCQLADTSPLRKLDNFHHRPWMPVPEFISRMPVWRWNIALAPVTDHDFNRSKSAIKMCEAAYCKIPCLASWITPYEGFCHHDPELQWLLCSGASSWERKLRDLVYDKDRRDDLGRRMHKVMVEHYSYRKPHEGWQEAFRLAREGSGEIYDATEMVIESVKRGATI
jgi:hypothetical protein